MAQLPRLDLQDLLIEILDSDNVYFQPPSNVEMKYPCIVYNRESIDPVWGNGKPYKLDNRYQVTVIDRDPDSEIPDKVANLPKCIHDRFFIADNLNHNVFRLFF
jgi:hypothetical protein